MPAAALLRCRATVQAAEHGYLLHRVWLDDYCVWVQQQPEERLTTLADQLGALQLERDAVGWPLQAYGVFPTSLLVIGPAVFMARRLWTRR